MAKITANYEAMYILDPDLMEGYSVLMTFNAAAAIPAELDRIFRITDGVMRSLIVCKDQ